MCTDFLVNIPGETAVVGRSMEFAAPLNSTVQFVRHNDSFVSVESDRKWNVNYSYVAVKGNVEAAGKTISMTTDGQNTEGLSIGALWFKGFADFPGIQKPTVGVNLCHAIDFILATYSTVQQVIDDINSKKLVIWALEIESIAAPIHFPIHDKTGASGVIEYTKINKNIEIDLHTPEELRRGRINPAAVITNSPGLEWHLNNLGYYASLTNQATTIPVGVQPTIAKPKPYPVEGMGAGYRGIPGDSFPASRFVSTFYRLQDSVNYITNVQSTDPSLPKSDPVNLAFHLLNAVDISFGQSKDFVKSGPHDSKYKYDYTQWVVVKDLINNKMHIRTYENLNIHTIDLTAIFSDRNYITENASYKLSNPIPPLAAN